MGKAWRNAMVLSIAIGVGSIGCSATRVDSAGEGAAATTPQQLSGGADSVDALIGQFLAALQRRDLDALANLRVDKEEYLGIIVPGTVPKGEPPRRVSEQPAEYFWETLDFKSRRFAEVLVGRYGGHHFVDYHLEFTRPEREYDWYTARGKTYLTLQADDDTVYRMETGWIAEVGGKYKFIGYDASV